MPEPSTDQWMAIQRELFAGRKIEAIKLYRQATDVGLTEAKEAMDGYEVKLRSEAPDRFSAPAKSGCFAMFLLIIALAVGGWAIAHAIC